MCVTEETEEFVADAAVVGEEKVEPCAGCSSFAKIEAEVLVFDGDGEGVCVCGEDGD